MEFLHHLPADKAKLFLVSLAPLLQQRRELREALMLVLRKAVFQRTLDVRTVAVEGMTELLMQGRWS